MQDYNDSGTSTDVLTTCVGGTTTTLTASGSWGGDAGQFATNGTYHNSSHFSDSDGAYVDDITYTWSCDSCMATLTVVEGEEGDAGTNTYPARPLTGSWLEEFAGQWGAMAEFSYSEQLSKSYPPQSPPCTDPDTFTDSVGETICSQTTLLTGGKGVASQQILFEMGVSAEKYIPVTVPDGRGFGWNTQGIAPGQMTVAGKKVGYDGNLWTVLPSGTTVDITPQAPPPNYTYSVTAAGTPVKIIANSTIDLSTTNPTFCVGQQVNFALNLIAPSPGNAVVNWSLPGEFVNESWQAQEWVNGLQIPYGSVNYDKNLALLGYTTTGSIGTSCWYINRGGGTVSVAASLLFGNGQTASVAAMGNFNIYKPTVKWQPLFAGLPQVVISAGKLSLGNGGSAAGMSFMHYIQSDFSGTAGYTQLISGEYDSDISVGINGSELDNTLWARGLNTIYSTGSWTQNAVEFDDSPSIGLANINSTTAMNLSFQTYLRFMPDGGPGPNIFVTLQLITWGVTASATEANRVWSVDPGSSSSGPNTSDSDAFPVWTETFSGSSGIFR